MQFDNLTPEMREKARACSSPEELLSLAKEFGYELSDEELTQVSGGKDWLCSEECVNDCVWLCNTLHCSVDN